MRYAETAVAMLLFTCPNTNRKAPTGVEMDVQGLRAQWKARLKLDCPYCSDVHDICVREVYVNGALDNLDRPRRAERLGICPPVCGYASGSAVGTSRYCACSPAIIFCRIRL